MRAIVQHRYGPPREVLALEDIAGPLVGANDVLVRIHAASVNPADWHVIRGDPFIARLSFGLRGPKDPVPGCDLAGRVEAVGSAVRAFGPGDEVFGSSFMRGFGAFAETASVPHDILAVKPANLSFEHTSALPVGALTALQGLRDHGQVTRSPSECRRALTPKATLLLSSGESSGHVIGPLGRVVKARALSPFVGQKMVSFTVKPNTQDLESVKTLVESGDVSPVIDRSYPLAEVPEAIAYLEEGHARGKVVIEV